MFNNWGKRDYVWLIAVLIGIIFMILVWRLNDNDSVVNIISMLASGASIALAIMAMQQSSDNNRDTNNIYNAINEKISRLESNTDFMIQNCMKDINNVINNSDIDNDEKIKLQSEIKKVDSFLPLANGNFTSKYRKRLVDTFIEKFKMQYRFCYEERQKTRFGCKTLFKDAGNKKYKIEIAYLDIEEQLDEDGKVAEYLNDFISNINDVNQYMIVICDGIISTLDQIIEDSDRIFHITEEEILDNRNTNFNRYIKLSQ